MSDVIEQGATRRLSPSDFGRATGRNKRIREPGQPYKLPNGGRGEHRNLPPPPRERTPFFEKFPHLKPRQRGLTVPDPNARARRKAALAFGRRFGRALDPFSRVERVIEFGSMLMQTRTGGWEPTPDGGWVLATYCPAEWPRADTSGPQLTPGWDMGDPAKVVCLGGQNMSLSDGTLTVPSPGTRRFGIWRRENPDGPLTPKYTHGASWERSLANSNLETSGYQRSEVTTVAMEVMADPNMMRNLPTLPPPAGSVAPQPPRGERKRLPAPPRYKGIVLTQRGRVPRGNPHKRKPDRYKTKTKKAIGGGQEMFRTLAVISEVAEVIDALFEALPQSTQDRYMGKPRWWQMPPEWQRDNQGLLDRAGQYGIDRADVKLVALWYNWYSVDVDKFIKNVGSNLLFDRIVGEAHGRGADLGLHGI